jgi:hypothetical protein
MFEGQRFYKSNSSAMRGEKAEVCALTLPLKGRVK